ncbi:thiaminase (transcriptional activator TenA) [Rhizobiales bacterium GAS113]|nr:thiaminase (transcriptional activator TenA) [Rhizobiales bacterium GAS113]
MPLSDVVLAQNRDAWNAMQTHRFVRDVMEDRMPKAVFHRYLVYEGAFVGSAIVIFGQAMIKAPTLDRQRRLIGVLAALAGDQMAYFEKTYAALGIDPTLYKLSSPAADAFRSGMIAIAAEGGYADVITAMFAAEWMYWHWCRRAAKRPIGDPTLREWVDLHAEDAFAAQAKWLKSELDLAGVSLDEAERHRLSALFGRVLRLEIDFHLAAYGRAGELPGDATGSLRGDLSFR